MGQLIGVSIGGPYGGVIVIIIVLSVAISLRLYMMRHQGLMRAKCPKCGNVFDASCSISLLHFGTLKQMKCPACGKISLMNTHVKNPITWPPEEKNQHQQQAERQLTQEEVENKRIEESKYEKA